MTAPHTIEFEFEVDALGQSVTVEATVRLSPPGHPHPGDPDNDAELEIESVTLNGWDVDPDGIKVAKEKAMFPVLGPVTHIPEWFLLTDLIREAAWERAELEAA
ncbi:hypothetical protein LCGC14_1620840 [marine sediment metagenome]|uniref:Uncharacterized protein n=1 Tax=marine sediment metagenome TaxID=412755 RepID=A0A0F9L5F0_9ZZZZ